MVKVLRKAVDLISGSQLPANHLDLGTFTTHRLYAAHKASGLTAPLFSHGQQQHMAAELGGRPLLPPPPPLPWAPVLTRAQLRRGLSFYGSGERIERVAAKLMAGEPITIVTLGASVTRGQGASEEATAYPSLLFDFISNNFPHRQAQQQALSAVVATQDLSSSDSPYAAGGEAPLHVSLSTYASVNAALLTTGTTC
jgi:hypothetical protein